MNELVLEYLSGKKFDSGANIDFIDNENKILTKETYLMKISKNKNIIHFGFLDHVELIENKIKNNDYLHKKLIECSNECFGIDINQEGIKYLRENHNFQNLYALDIINDELPSDILNKKFEYILIPDVIEHIGNPVLFLKSIRKKFKNNTESIILTTPNAFRLDNFKNVFKHIECINTDHRFWFTQYTIAKIATDAGFKIKSVAFLEDGYISRREIIKKLLLKKFAGFRDTIFIELLL